MAAAVLAYCRIRRPVQVFSGGYPLPGRNVRQHDVAGCVRICGVVVSINPRGVKPLCRTPCFFWWASRRIFRAYAGGLHRLRRRHRADRVVLASRRHASKREIVIRAFACAALGLSAIFVLTFGSDRIEREWLSGDRTVSNLSHRTTIWKWSFKRVAQQPWGFGFTTGFRTIFLKIPMPEKVAIARDGLIVDRIGQTHNAYIEFLIGTGWLGAAALLMVVGGIYLRLFEVRERAIGRIGDDWPTKFCATEHDVYRCARRLGGLYLAYFGRDSAMLFSCCRSRLPSSSRQYLREAARPARGFSPIAPPILDGKPAG